MIAFIADIHISTRHKNVPVEWANKRYDMLIEQMTQINCSRMILGGDIFDKIPSMEELAIYFKMVKAITVPCIIYSGNHEMLKKTQSFFSYLKEPTNSINPLVSVVDTLYEENSFYIVGYELIHKKGIWESLLSDKAVFTHVRGEIPPHVKPEISLDLLKPFPIVYAGDLHSHSNTQANIVYPGSPCTTSFHRSEVETGYILIDEEDLTQWSWHPFSLPQLIRKTVSDPSEMIDTNYHRTVYELEGSVVDLGGIKNSELLDKKLVKRSTDTTLILSPNMSLEEELIEYFTYVLELPDNQIQEAISTLHDFIPKS